MANFNFREANLDDLAVLLKLEQQIINAERPFDANLRGDDATYYDLDELIKSDSTSLLIVECEGKIVGTGYIQVRASKPVHIHDSHGYLGFIYVEPDFRGAGLSGRIVQQLIDWGNQRGLEHYHLDVYANNAAAVRAYEKWGFRKTLVKMELAL